MLSLTGMRSAGFGCSGISPSLREVRRLQGRKRFMSANEGNFQSSHLNIFVCGEMAESAEGARLLSEYVVKAASRVRIPVSPPFSYKEPVFRFRKPALLLVLSL